MRLMLSNDTWSIAELSQILATTHTLTLIPLGYGNLCRTSRCILLHVVRDSDRFLTVGWLRSPRQPAYPSTSARGHRLKGRCQRTISSLLFGHSVSPNDDQRRFINI